ncbi:hypothetical protein AB0H60_34130 [Nocardia rhamnosiphila]|uniref:hypothetical protein n=1 Tax=Nocardia rhamnosiphila TaxID=426716 RepID=UPI0033CD12E4
MTSDATPHHADYVGDGRWVVDYLPGRQLTKEQARAAMKIAIAPERLEVERWAKQLGMTPAEVRGYAAMPVVATSRVQEIDAARLTDPRLYARVGDQ